MTCLSSYILLVDAHLRTRPDAGERAIYLNREIESLKKRERALGVGFPQIKSELLLRKARLIEEIQANIRSAEAAPSFAHRGER